MKSKINHFLSFLFFLSVWIAFSVLTSKEAYAACLNVPVSGNYTVSACCAFTGTVDGVDNGGISVAAAQTLTINAGQTIVWSPGSSITINASIATNATADKAILPAGLTEFTINTAKVTAADLIYVTPLGNTQNQVLYVKSKQTCQQSEGSDPSCFPWFKVAINQPLPYDLEFNWWIIKLEPEKAI